MNKADLIKKCEELGINTEALATNDKGNVTNDTLKAAIAAAEAAANESKESPASAPDQNETFDVNGKAYTFSKRMPQTLQIDGEIFTKTELLNQKEILERLVLGNSPFITPF